MPKLTSEVRAGVIVLFFGLLGMIMAFIEQYLVENSYVLDEFIADSITLPDLQIVTIIFALLVGTVLAALTS